VVPPAFSEVGKDMLPGKLDTFIQEAPQVKNISISDYHHCQEPVHQVHQEVMINVSPKVFELEGAVIIISMHFLGDRLVEVGVNESPDLSAGLWPL